MTRFWGFPGTKVSFIGLDGEMGTGEVYRGGKRGWVTSTVGPTVPGETLVTHWRGPTEVPETPLGPVT